jgi:hypothetical protein
MKGRCGQQVRFPKEEGDGQTTHTLDNRPNSLVDRVLGGGRLFEVDD